MKKKRGKSKLNLYLLIAVIILYIIIIGIYFLAPSPKIPTGKGELPSGGVFPQGAGECLISSEAVPLFTAYSGLYPDDSINKVKGIINSTDLPILLKSSSFLGTNYLQTISLGGYPQLAFAKQPTSADDPAFGILLSSSSLNYIYNTTVKFNSPIDFTAPTSKNQEIELFGNKYIVSDETNSSFLVLVNSNSSEKIKFKNDAAAMTGDNNEPIWGTFVTLKGGVTSLSEITIITYASDSDHDFLKPYEFFTDPVFGTFKLDFSAGLNIGDNDYSREVLEVSKAGDDKVQIKGLLKDTYGNSVSFNWAKNWTNGKLELQSGDQGKNITVMEGQPVYKGEYLVVGNEDTGKLLKVYDIYNSTSSDYSLDRVRFQDVATSETIESVIISEGHGSVTVAGKSYDVWYYGAQSAPSSDNYNLTVISSDAGTLRAVYPTIQSMNGAKVAFYEPELIDMSSITGIKIPNGNGYTTISWIGNITYDIWGLTLNTSKSSGASSVTMNFGQFIYNLTSVGIPNKAMLYVMNGSSPLGGGGGGGGGVNTLASEASFMNIVNPALIIIEKKDGYDQYNSIMVTLKPGATNSSGLGVDDVIRTWGNDQIWKGNIVPSNTNLVKQADLFGVITTFDSSTNQKKALISIPAEQVRANLYITHENACSSTDCIDHNNGTLSYNGNTYYNTCSNNQETYYCDWDGKLYSTGKNCTYGCDGNFCKSYIHCGQSRGGINYSIPGMIVLIESNNPLTSYTKLYDHCEDLDYLIKYYCIGGNSGDNGSSIDRHLCEYGCYDNRCLTYPTTNKCSSLNNDVKSMIVNLTNLGKTVVLIEGYPIYKNQYFIIGDDLGIFYLMKVYDIYNSSSDFANDKVRFQNVFSGEVYDVTITSEGVGDIPIGGRSGFVIKYYTSDLDPDNFYMTWTNMMHNISYNFYNCVYCGDASCNNGETCSSCSQDCGSCGGDSGGGSSGGGGSGGGGTSSKTYTPQNIEMLGGYTQQLNKNDKIVFSLSGASHSLVVNQLTSNSATVTIMSSPLSLTLKVGEIKKLNLTSPDYYDLQVKLESITNNVAKLTIKTIREDINQNNAEDNTINPKEESPTETNNNLLIYIAVALILIIIIIALIIIKFRKKR